MAEQRTHNPSVGGSIPPGPTPPAPPLPFPPGRLDRLVAVLLFAALLLAGGALWQALEVRTSVDDRLRLFAEQLGPVPGLLVLLAAVFAAAWTARVAVAPLMAVRARVLLVMVLAVAIFLALGQIAGMISTVTTGREVEYLGPLLLYEASGAAMSIAAVSSASRRLAFRTRA